MRVINTKTLELEEFYEESMPPYAILSHTWGQGEITLQDLRKGNHHLKRTRGSEKLQSVCQLAHTDGLQYCWVDTCCIDKTSSAELSEAINSQFAWYHGASVCYVYLSDVQVADDTLEDLTTEAVLNSLSKSRWLYLSDVQVAEDTLEDLTTEAVLNSLSKSRWFTRGWTLSELLAPPRIVFFDASWRQIGTKVGLCDTLQRITGVPRSYLKEGASQSALALLSVAEKMSWAARRQTTRIEDIAYCLMGLFGVHMPILYGEGERAFSRLQNEILKKTTDQSLFAWRRQAEDALNPTSIFARSPSDFLFGGETVAGHGEPLILAEHHASVWKQRMDFSNIGLTTWMPLVATLSDQLVFAVLNCEIQKRGESRVKLWLALWRTDRGSFHRIGILSGVVDPSGLVANSAIPLGEAEMICIEDAAFHLGKSYVQRPVAGEGSRVGVLVVLPLGKQSFETLAAASFPAADARELGIFWLFSRDTYHYGILAFEGRAAGALTKRVAVFFACASMDPQNFSRWVWTCRILPSLDEAAYCNLETVAESELEKLRSEGRELTGGGAPDFLTSCWRTSDQSGETVVRLDRPLSSYSVAGGVVNLASIVFDHPLGESQLSALGDVFRELSVS
jgi:hypothetical protein